MTLVRWQPERDLPWNAQRDISRLFDDMWNRPTRGRRQEGAWYPEVDIEERSDAFVVEMDVPGMDREELKVTMENNTLVIRGERKQERTGEKQDYHVAERQYGTFQRAFSLPQSVDSSKIRATYRDGVLGITLPKSEEAKLREIDIDIK
ncbi:MAG: Hsp20/alpha crystallin family protein [bacterium]